MRLWSGRVWRLGVAAGVVLAVLCARVRAQDEPLPVGEPSIQQYEDYLEGLGLRDVLAAHLRARARESSGDGRLRVAERLGGLYVGMLQDATTAQARNEIEAFARELLTLVPESETFELRINLAKVSYLQAEDVAERDRLRLATPEERAEAMRLLRGVAPTFEDIARQVQSRIDSLERMERNAADDTAAKLREDQAAASRVRSLARYYMGWTSYYLALLHSAGQDPSTMDTSKALENFGWILQAVPGKPPTISQLPKALLQYEHVGRAALGTALTVALKGNDVDAIRWLDEISAVEELHPAVREQLFTRRVIIYAGAGRWADAEGEIRRRRQPDLSQPAIPLTPADARLAAVLGLEATRAGGNPKFVEAAERVAQVGMGDLVALGEVSQILDLVSRYGTAPIGDTGFIVQYVQGLKIYESTRQEHKASGEAPDDPASRPQFINSYRQAAELLRLALASPDAPKFAAEASRALMRRGFALYYAGDLEQASAAFQQSHQAAAAPDLKRDALWYSIVALDRAVDAGRVSLSKERDRLAVLYLQQFPDTEDAAKLLLRQAQADLLGDEETLKILLAVAPEQPLYDAARRQATRLLYRVYRRSPASDRGFAAIRFADIAEEVLRVDSRRAGDSNDEASRKAAQNVLLLVRQLADALLSGPAPDVKRVESALQLLEAVAELHKLDLASIEPELAYRRLQVAIAQDNAADMERCILRLRRNTGEFALAGERLLYRRALDLWAASPDDPVLAAQVVRHGRSILDHGTGKDAWAAAIRVNVAAAAAKLWTLQDDHAMRDLAMELDKKSVESGGRTIAVLRRLAEMSETAGDLPTALASWQNLFSALPAGQPDWFEARYNSLRLLWRTDQAAAVAAMAQFKALYPSMGVEPWRQRLVDLEREMRIATPAPPSAIVAPSPKGGAK
jgi:hypothetical protein